MVAFATERLGEGQTPVVLAHTRGALMACADVLARAQIGYHVFKILEEKKLKQREISDILGIAQPDVSHLMNGHFSRFTTDKLLDFLKRLNRKVTIEVSRHHKGEPYQQVTFAP